MLLALFCVNFPPLPNLEIFRPWNISDKQVVFMTMNTVFDKQVIFITMKNKGQNLCFYPKNPLTETSRLLRRFLSSKMTFQGAFFAIWCKQLINHHLHISSSITGIQLNITSSGSPSLESEVIFILGTSPKMTHRQSYNLQFETPGLPRLRDSQDSGTPKTPKTPGRPMEKVKATSRKFHSSPNHFQVQIQA